MLLDLRDHLLAESRQFGVYQLWKNYKVLDISPRTEAGSLWERLRIITILKAVAGWRM